MSRKPTLAIGVFLPEPVQLMDLSAIDLFYMMTPEYLTACRLPAPMISQGVAFDIHYIGRANNNSHCQLTAAANLRLTKTTKDPEVQPGKLDIILVPGPDPSTIADEEIKGFLHSHANWTGPKGERTDILSVCTGCTLLAQSGILVGKKASAPRLLVPTMRKEYSRTTWIDDKRWVADANIWSSGGITNGQEMVAAYLREKFPGPVADVVIAMADVGDKGIEYTTSRTVDTVWMVWQMFKAFWWSKTKIA